MDAASRVQAALDSFNTQKIMLEGNVEVTLKLDRYDYETTHYNWAAHNLLQDAIISYDNGLIKDEQIKYLIGDFRDRSEVGWIDFSIRVVEPTKERFEHLERLFAIKRDKRLVAIQMLGTEHRKHLAQKLYDTLGVLTRQGNKPTAKMLAQFEQFFAREAEPSVDLLGLRHALTEKLEKPLTKLEVTLNRDCEAPEIKEPITEQLLPADNSHFEARLAPRAAMPTSRRSAKTVTLTPVEIHVELNDKHPEFAAWCEEIFAQK